VSRNRPVGINPNHSSPHSPPVIITSSPLIQEIKQLRSKYLTVGYTTEFSWKDTHSTADSLRQIHIQIQ